MLPLMAFALALSGQATINYSAPGVAVRHAPLGGLPLCVWNDSSLFTKLRPGMIEADQHLFRYPNGSTSNLVHWNSAGSYDADSVWVPADSVFLPGFQGETIYRGISKSSYGFIRPSLICDGDTNTYWWSNPEHPDAPGQFTLDFAVAKPIDSLRLWLGDVRPDSVQVMGWTGADGVYPAPHQQFTGWVELARVPVAALAEIKFATVTTRYLAVRPLGVLAHGWKVREAEMWAAGTQVSVNTRDQVTQTLVVAASSHPASRPSPNTTSTWDFETYMKWIAAYPGAQPMICVNYGTGTAQEAAAWVHYANKVKNYAIQRWQVGNEVAGVWEEGGAVSARQYAVRFVQFAKAMKAVDPSIQIEGPVLPDVSFVQNGSGDFDGHSWMEGFLMYVDSAEKKDVVRYLDGVDFHTYPYWFAATPKRTDMLKACDGNGASFDTLVALMARTIDKPLTREILMTEYNTSTVSSSLEQEVSGASAAGLQLAHFVQRFGDRGVAVFWELYEGGSVGPDQTFGTLSAFNKPTQGIWSSLGYPPNSSFWMLRTLMRDWMDPTGGDTVMPITQVSNARLFALRNLGRTSILAINLKGSATVVSLNPALVPAGEILTWGAAQYLWNGTGTDAYAYPNNGPSSRLVPAAWDGKVSVPAYGMVVVRAARPATVSVKTAHLLVRKSKVGISDSIQISGWSVATGTQVTGGYWKADSGQGVLMSADTGRGSTLAWSVSVPASQLGVGNKVVRLVVKTAAGDSAVDSVVVRVTGDLRQVMLVSNFDKSTNKSISTTWGDKWTSYSVASNLVTYAASIDTVLGVGSPYLKVVTSAAQPVGLGYDVFAGVGFGFTNLDLADTTLDLVGLVYDYKNTQSQDAQAFRVLLHQSNIDIDGNYNDYVHPLPSTNGAWIHDTLLFENCHQGDWGPSKVVPFDLSLVTGIDFRSDRPGDAMVGIDNVFFLGTRGAAVSGIVPRVQASLLGLHGRVLAVGSNGPWSLKLVDATGRTVRRWTGRDAGEVRIERPTSTLWAVLDAQGRQQVLAIAPVIR